MNIRISCLSGHYHKAQKKNRQSFLLFITLFMCACSVSESTPKDVSSPSFSKADAIIIAQNDLTANAGKKAFERGGTKSFRNALLAPGIGKTIFLKLGYSVQIFLAPFADGHRPSSA